MSGHGRKHMEPKASNTHSTNKHMAQGHRGEIRGAGRGLVAEELAEPQWCLHRDGPGGQR